MKKLILLLFIPLVFSCSDDKKNDLDELKLNGKVKSLKEITYSAVEKFGEPVKNTFLNENEYLFEKNGNIAEIRYEFEFQEGFSYKNIYEDNGNLIERNQYKNSGELEVKFKFKYDDNGNMIQYNQYNKDGDLEHIGKNKFDEAGNWIEQNYYDNDGELKSNWKNKYDDDGNMIEQKEFNKNGELESNRKIKYDDKGNMVYESRYDENGELEYGTEYEYKEFDREKNWVKRIGYEDGKATEITEREIEYYD